MWVSAALPVPCAMPKRYSQLRLDHLLCDMPLTVHTPACLPAAVLAVLAFFALRPGRGWLRRKPEAAAAEDGQSGQLPPTPRSSEAGSSLRWVPSRPRLH